MRLAIRSTGAMAVTALIAAGCGGGNGTTTTGGGTASISSAAAPCRAVDLDVKPGPGNGATGHLVRPIGMRNTAGHKCGLRGYPHVSLLDRNGAPLTVTVKPRSVDFFGRLPVRAVTVQAAGQASARLTFETAINGGNCPTAQSASLRWPGSGGSATIRLGNQLACPGGVTVSPFAAGRAAWKSG